MESYIIGMMATILTSSALIPQIWKTYRTKSAKDLSVLTLVQYILGVSLWLTYGFMIDNKILISANVVGLISFLTLIILKLRF